MSRRPSWATVPNKPAVYVDVKQLLLSDWILTPSQRVCVCGCVGGGGGECVFVCV